MLSITPIYACLLAMLFIFLSVRTLKQRRVARVALGAGENQELLRRIRVHANFSEYVPLALIMATYAELLAVHSIIVHVICICLLAGRLSHAFGVSHENENFSYRVIGMTLTFTSLGISVLAILGAVTFVGDII